MISCARVLCWLAMCSSAAVACSSSSNGGATGSGATGSGAAGSAGAMAGGSGGSAAGSSCPTNPPAGLPDSALTRYAQNPLVRNGPADYDISKAGPRVVLKMAAGDYRMWYEAVAVDLRTVIAYATSADGLTWNKQGPVMEPSSTWEGNEVSPNSILVEGGTFKLWYHGGGSVSVHRNTGYATSADGLTWARLPQPVLNVGPAGAFDDDEAVDARVFQLGSEYRMYYTGKNESSTLKSLGVATSSDGMVWTKRSDNPILDANRWGNFWGGAFFLEGDIWHLWHAVDNGGGGGLAYAWSRDGIQWTDGASNPVLQPSGAANGPDGAFVGDSVSGYRDGATYRIMYSGFATNLFGSDGRFEGICMASIAATCP